MLNKYLLKCLKCGDKSCWRVSKTAKPVCFRCKKQRNAIYSRFVYKGRLKHGGFEDRYYPELLRGATVKLSGR